MKMQKSRKSSQTEMIFHLCYGVVITKFDLVFATKLLDPSNSFVVYDTFCVSKAITLIFTLSEIIGLNPSIDFHNAQSPLLCTICCRNQSKSQLRMRRNFMLAYEKTE